MPSDNIVALPNLKEALRAAQIDPKQRLEAAGGGGQPPGMETELALLKQRADQTDQRLERIEVKLDRLTDAVAGVSAQLGAVATKGTVWTALGTGAAIAFAVAALFVAVLAYLQDQRIATRPEAPMPPAPVILQLPPWPAAPPGLPAPAN